MREHSERLGTFPRATSGEGKSQCCCPDPAASWSTTTSRTTHAGLREGYTDYTLGGWSVVPPGTV